jgi:hypothetical protein
MNMNHQTVPKKIAAGDLRRGARMSKGVMLSVFPMRLKAVPILLIWLLIMVGACHRKPAASASAPNPSTTPADGPLTNPAAFTAAIERRWPRENIVRFCSQGRRHWNGCQNLVASPLCEQKGEVWEADLFKGSDTGFDRVWWYATVCDSKIQAYSLNARRGNDHWLIEIGDLATFAIQPEIEPSSKMQCFEEGDHSRYK